MVQNNTITHNILRHKCNFQLDVCEVSTRLAKVTKVMNARGKMGQTNLR